MKLIRKKKLLQTVAVFMAVNLIGQIVFPTVSYALTAGPGSPEFASFEPVATTDMVNVFSGDFTYNLPVVNVPGPGGGYAMSLSYHSGVSSEQEASWVGFGWTLNPGAINRSVRGVPDEYNGEDNGATIDYFQKMRPNWTVGATKNYSLEALSNSADKLLDKNPILEELDLEPKISFSSSLRYNNFQGFQRSLNLGADFKGYGSIGMQASASGITFSSRIDYNAMNKTIASENETKRNTRKLHKLLRQKSSEFTALKNGDNKLRAAFNSAGNGYSVGISSNLVGAAFGLLSFAEDAPSASNSNPKGYAFNFSDGLLITPAPITIGVEGARKASFAMRYTTPKVSRPAIGYLHKPKKEYNEASEGYANDYYMEKSAPYNKRDLHIGIPVGTPDNFLLTGEGLSGSFRFHAPGTAGHYYPNFHTNTNTSYNIGIEPNAGGTAGLGLKLGAGFNMNILGDWLVPGRANDYQFNDQPRIARFSGDLGSKVDYGEDNDVFAPDVFNTGVGPGKGIGTLMFRKKNFDLNVSETYPYEEAGEIRRSSYIKNDDNLSNFEIYNPSGARYSYGLRKYANEETGATQLVRNETSLAVSIEEGASKRGDIVLGEKLYLYQEDNKYKVRLDKHNIVKGEIKGKEYASAYMLGEITDANYVDVSNDGPSDDDFGSWVKFNYHKKYGDNNHDGNASWYRYRIPYVGLKYSRNTVSEKKDDIGSVSTGEKDVHYLKKVETKTHVAYFVTNKTVPARFAVHEDMIPYLQGSQKKRFDGLGAEKLGDLDSYDPHSMSSRNFVDGRPELEYLEKVVLFSKGDPSRPLQTTYFRYDYELVGNLPNSRNSKDLFGNSSRRNTGKLTLKKVWTEYNGVVSSKISPYEFSYEYKDKNNFSNDFIGKYPYLVDFFNKSTVLSRSSQNPDYSPFLLDAWGNPQINGEERFKRDMKWPYQGQINETTVDFDPAAWHLKQIKLPSGGEILVEYEQKKYNHVQDRVPMALARIKSVIDNRGLANKINDNPKYTIDLEDIGISSDEVDRINEVLRACRKYFLQDSGTDGDIDAVNNWPLEYKPSKAPEGQGNRLYFKILYSFNNNVPQLENNCHSEYITGYCKVFDIKKVGNTLEFTLDGKGSNYKNGYSMVPDQGCYDLYASQKVGKTKNCDGGAISTFTSVDEKFQELMNENIAKEELGNHNIRFPGGFLQTFGNVIKSYGQLLINRMRPISIPSLKSFVCYNIKNELSYLKIPMVTSKRGGGVRVKKLLMYDPGIEEGSEAIFGKQYHYVDENGNQSGVATNEPPSMREENALVTFMPKKSQNWISRHAVGADKSQSEGPLGESLLPSASVGHSRVIEENIHTGTTGTGFTVHDFKTVKDYPFDKVYNYSNREHEHFDIAANKPEKGVDFTQLSRKTPLPDLVNVGFGPFGASVKRMWMAQGYRFIQNDMHGKPSAVKTYSGTLPVDENYDFTRTGNVLTQGTEFSFYEPGEQVRVLYEEGGVKKFKWDTPGKEVDVSMERKAARELNLDLSLELDISFAPPMIIYVTVMGHSIRLSEKSLATHSTSKVIKYSALPKSQTTFRDGLKTIMENLAFDHGTGNPIVTRTTDIFEAISKPGNEIHDGSIYNLATPAYWHYDGMGAKAISEENNNQLTANAGSTVLYGKDAISFNDGTSELAVNYDGNTLSASAQTFAKSGDVQEWFGAGIAEEYGVTVASQTILDNIWRPHQTWVYKTGVSNKLNNENAKIYGEGKLADFSPFSYGGTLSPNWIKTNEVTHYSPNGEPVEEVNVKGIHSTARYAYNHTKPVIVVQNASYEEVGFESFEDGNDLSLKTAHSGKNRAKNGVSKIFEGLRVTQNLLSNGALIRYWVSGNGGGNYDVQIKETRIIDFPKGKKIAEVGLWSMFEIVIPGDKFDVYNLNDKLDFEVSSSERGSVCDDIRFTPADATAKCFVYDPESHRLVAEFDDQHFATFYQYNGEGKLVRSLKETERGIRTIEERQYNLPTVKR